MRMPSTRLLTGLIREALLSEKDACDTTAVCASSNKCRANDTSIRVLQSEQNRVARGVLRVLGAWSENAISTEIRFRASVSSEVCESV